MLCPNCGADVREGSNFCRYCAQSLPRRAAEADSGYIPSVPPPPPDASARPFNPIRVEPAPQPPARRPYSMLVCPRCGSTHVLKGSTPTWAIVTSVAAFLLICFVSLLFLLIKDPNTCLDCGLSFK